MNEKERMHDIDWLRVLGMLSIFVFHSGRYFDTEGWHIKNPQVYRGMDIFIGFLVQWIMPLFFILSAFSAYYAIRARGSSIFIKERLKRLGIPFLLGTFVFLIPVQVYIERFTHGQFSGSFLQFYPHYFEGWYGFGGNFAWMGLHLWYLQVLLIFSLLVLPLFLLLNKSGMENILKGTAAVLNRPLGLLVLAVPLTIVEILISRDPSGIGMRNFGGWSLITYLLFFITGYLLALISRYNNHVAEYRFYYLFLALALTITGFLLLRNGFSYNGVIISGIRSMNTWCWLLSFLAFSSKYLRKSNRVLKYANTAVLPFYVLHQTVIILIAFFLLKWEAGLLLKWPALGVLSFIVIMFLYHVIIRRIRFLRFLFGMRLR